MSSPGIKATPSGTVTGYSVSVPSRRDHPCNVTSRSGRWGSSACSQMATCSWARRLFCRKASSVGGSEDNDGAELLRWAIFCVQVFCRTSVRDRQLPWPYHARQMPQTVFQQLLSTAARAELNLPDQVHTLASQHLQSSHFADTVGWCLWEHGLPTNPVWLVCGFWLKLWCQERIFLR